MMTERQRQFRAQYKAAISRRYNGLVHIGVMYGAGVAAIGYCAAQLQAPTWQWLLVIPTFVAGNFVEWAMHRFVMHRRIDVFALRAIYERHTRQHHQYFTDHEPSIDSVREFRIVFFPWRVLLVLGVFGALIGSLSALVVDANAGYIVFMTMIGYYMTYETFHYCCHIADNGFVRHMPFVNTIRRHHTAHHNMGIMMHVNMNLTFPIADWFLGTSDLDRGLVGHLFNGDDVRHVKPALAPLVARFRSDETQSARCSLDGPDLDAGELQAVASATGRLRERQFEN